MNFIKELLNTYKKGTKYDSLKAERDLLSLELEAERAEGLNQYDNLQEEIKNLEQAYQDLAEEKSFEAEAEFKKYWYNKYPKINNKMWNGTWLKDYCKKGNDQVPLLTGNSNDSLANKALVHVRNYMTYTSDEKEHWQLADESVDRKLGDCEDGAILMYNIMIKAGIPPHRVRLNAGNVKSGTSGTGGHAWVTYLREKDNKWYIMDWCYWYDESRGFQKTWGEAEKYFDIWFSWNNDYVWIEENQGRE